MIKIILYIAISADGFIADKSGGVSWLDEYGSTGEDCGYHDFFKSIDIIAMGRKTYEQMLTFGDWPNAGKMSYVFTKESDVPLHKDITFVSTDVKEFMNKMNTEHPNTKLWLEGGAQLVKSFYDAGLIDEYIITIVPKKIGQGIALLPEIVHGQDMKLIDELKWPSGILQKHYAREI